MPTLVAAAGDPDIRTSSCRATRWATKRSRTTSTAITSCPYFKGEVAEAPRREFFYFSDNGDLMALRYNAWKISFKTIEGNLFTGRRGTDQRSVCDQSASRIRGSATRMNRRSMVVVGR